RRVDALDPLVDQAIGESIHVRHWLSTLQTAVYGLFRALDGWRGVAIHLRDLPDEAARQGAEAGLRSIPPERRSALTSPTRWMADPMGLWGAGARASRALLALPAGTPSLRLLADETAKLFAGMSYALEGLALLVDACDQRLFPHRGFRLNVPDWLPAIVG